MTLQEKFAKITAGKRQDPNKVWLTNERMNASDPENPTLISVPVRQFAKPNNAYLKQGYTKFVPEKPAPSPVEAKQITKASEPVKI